MRVLSQNGFIAILPTLSEHLPPPLSPTTVVYINVCVCVSVRDVQDGPFAQEMFSAIPDKQKQINTDIVNS